MIIPDEAVTEIEKLREACKLVLLFHSGGPWDDERGISWANGLTKILGPASARKGDPAHPLVRPTNEATTRNLCRAVRAALGEPEKP